MAICSLLAIVSVLYASVTIGFRRYCFFNLDIDGYGTTCVGYMLCQGLVFCFLRVPVLLNR